MNRLFQILTGIMLLTCTGLVYGQQKTSLGVTGIGTTGTIAAIDFSGLSVESLSITNIGGLPCARLSLIGLGTNAVNNLISAQLAVSNSLSGYHPTNTDVECTGGSVNSWFYYPVITDSPRVVVNATNYPVLLDALLRRTAPTATNHDKVVGIYKLRTNTVETVTIKWDTAGNQFNGSNFVTHLVDGIDTGHWTSASLSWDTNVSFVANAVWSTNWMGGVAGSARSNACAAVDVPLSDRVYYHGDVTWCNRCYIFSTRNDAATSYVRNTNCWAYAYDLTPKAVWDSRRKDSVFQPTLVSPVHAIWADHVGTVVGTRVRWVSSNNVVCVRTVIGTVSIPGSDIQVARLDSPVDKGISFVKVLPKNYKIYFPNGLYRIPALCTDRHMVASVADVYTIDGSGTTGLIVMYPEFSYRAVFCEEKVTGDSGGLCAIVINNRLVGLGQWMYGSSYPRMGSRGPSWVYYHDEINAAMTTLGGGYRLTDVDLGGFNAY